ncbi:hypothetical protein DH2020_018746 [Rehmannia glutinosa]|uniref:CobW C-terminal domain-containing protein n=1 Tax=Rehmannia glutinosa TaxID=99300 RepID=A0ABR0WL66_REHGL
MATIPSASMDMAATFLGLAKSHSFPLSSINTTLFFCKTRPKIIAQTRKFLTSTTSANSRIVYSSKQTRKYFPRRFTVSGATTSAPETDDSDVLTKIPPDNRIPATIITGFLGSGKLLKMSIVAFLVCQYGEVDIDGSLVAAKSAGAEDIVMLNNGCLCCTVRGDLVRMIAELVNRKKGKFDHIVIETTGLANPAPIIQTFYAEDQVFNDVKLDGVVTLVDAKHAVFHLDEVKPKGVVNEVVEQIAYADRIIVNKSINRMAQLKRTQYGKVDLDYVLGIGGFDLERIDSAVEADHLEEDHHKHHDHHSHDHTHDPGVSSVSIVCEGTLDLEKANIWLGTLLLERSEDIYRMKGLLSVHGMDERFVFQGVHDIFQGSPDRLWGSDEPRINKLVFIGKNLDAQELEKGFKACLL